MDKIILPYPDNRLSPNARMNRYALSVVKQEARDVGFLAAKSSAVSVVDVDLQLFILIFPPDKRGRDDDNVLASLKSYRDGIFDALGINDRRVRLSTHGFGPVKHNGMVYVYVKPLTELPEWMRDE